jgi:hypothetical protein
MGVSASTSIIYFMLMNGGDNTSVIEDAKERIEDAITKQKENLEEVIRKHKDAKRRKESIRRIEEVKKRHEKRKEKMLSEKLISR